MSYSDILLEKARRLRDQGFLAEARSLLEDGLSVAPENAGLLCLLGEVCALLADHVSAVAYLRAALGKDPARGDALFLLGVTCENMGQPNEALECFQELRRLSPEMPLPLRWMGLILSELGRYEQALQCYHEALQLDPDYEEAQIGLASLLVKRHRLEEAEPLLLKVLARQPEHGSALNELARVYRLQGRAQEALALLKIALQADPDSRTIVSNLLYGLCDLADVTPEEVAREHFRLADRVFPPMAVPTGQINDAHCAANRPLHIAYLSGDFFTHSVAAFIEPILAHHATERFTIFCYSNTRTCDETTLRLKSYPVVWRDIVGISAADVAAMMRGDGIDILVDLSGHTAGNRLDVCALKPAPVVASWIGYPHSSGLSQIDYYLTDAWCDPPGLTDHLYRERLWRLPHIFSCYLPPLRFPEVAPAPQGLTGSITFGCFNNFSKVTEPVLALWTDILRQVEGSRLCLKSHALAGAGLQARLRKKFAEAGISPERLLFHGYVEGQSEHLALYGGIDIALDTYPYHGTTTTCEALWMGVPVITLAGSCHAARVGVSLLSAVGLAELIAATPDQYVARAVQLARDSAKLAALRENLRLMMATSPLMDAVGVTRDVESAYTRMFADCEAACPSCPADGSDFAHVPVPDAGDFDQLLQIGHHLYLEERFTDAAATLQQAVALEPNSARCRLLLGSALQSAGRPAEALHHFRYLLRFEADQLATLGKTGSDAYCLAATAAYDAGQEEYAYQLCGQAIQICPENFMARFKRCMYALRICAAGEDPELIRQRYAAELADLVHFELRDDDLLDQAVAAIGEMSPFLLPYLGGDDRTLQESYGGWLHSVMSRKFPHLTCRAQMSAHDKIRIGFVSAHFYLHSVWKMPVRGWLENLDRSKFTVFCYYTGTIHDPATQQAMDLSDRFVQTTEIEEVARSIIDDEIDVLIYPGIGMDPYAQQLAALRLAPVQCTSWGHPLTSGIPTVDYFLSSDLMEPDGAEAHYAERLVRLPNLSVVCYETPAQVTQMPDLLPELSPDDVLYLCCQNLYKYLPQHDIIFPAIALQVPSARFIFVNTHTALTERFMQRLKTAFAGYGLAAEQHVVILPALSRSEFDYLNSRVDIFLDNPEWSGANTTLESLPFNKPIVTIPGRFMRGRHTTAVLQMMDAAEMIAQDTAEYVALAVRLAKDTEFRAAMSAKISRNKTRIYDDQTCIRALESFLTDLASESKAA